MKTVKIQKPKRADADRSDGVEWAREMVGAGRARWNGGKARERRAKRVEQYEEPNVQVG